jgi:hypothetical protein
MAEQGQLYFPLEHANSANIPNSCRYHQGEALIRRPKLDPHTGNVMKGRCERHCKRLVLYFVANQFHTSIVFVPNLTSCVRVVYWAVTPFVCE